MVQNIQRYISQLGMMVIAVGLSSYNLALFHLVNHAFYKGLLFLGAGAVIHALADNQDFRKYGGLISFLPLSYSVMLIASLSLVAFPFMTGFYSKDFILESAYGQFNFSSVAVYFIATIGAMFTTLYSVKVLYLTFLSNANGPLINYKRAHEGDVFMSLPLIILAVLSIFFGYITKDMFIGMASGFFSDNSLFTHPLHEIMLETEFAVPTLFKLLPFFLTVTLSALSLILSEFLCKSLIYFKLTRMGYNIFSFFNQRLLIELFYNKYITGFILNLGGQTTKVLDKGSIELLGPYGLEKGLLRLSKSLSSLDTGVITSYALYILIGLILYILIPSISLKDISILLSILVGVLNISINTFYLGLTNNIPHPHGFTSLPLQSGFFSTCLCFIKKYLNETLLYTIFLVFFISIGLRIPTHFMLSELNMLVYFPLFNLAYTICCVFSIYQVKKKVLTYTRLAFICIFGLSAPLMLYLYSEHFHSLYLLIYYMLAELPRLLEPITICQSTGNPSTPGLGGSATGSGSWTGSGSGSAPSTGNYEETGQAVDNSCVFCASHGQTIRHLYGKHCKQCGYATNHEGRLTDRRKFDLRNTFGWRPADWVLEEQGYKRGQDGRWLPKEQSRNKPIASQGYSSNPYIPGQGSSSQQYVSPPKQGTSTDTAPATSRPSVPVPPAISNEAEFPPLGGNTQHSTQATSGSKKRLESKKAWSNNKEGSGQGGSSNTGSNTK